MRQALKWGFSNDTLPCLYDGVCATWPDSSFNQEEDNRHEKLYADIVADIAGPYYRAAWAR